MSNPMAETTSAPSLRELSEAAPKGPWTVRPQKFDDWGWVRGPLREDGFRPVIFVAMGDDDEAEQSAARAEGRQPRQREAISAFLCRLENDYRAGRLIDPTTLTEAVAAARAEGVREGLERAAGIIEKSAVPALRGVSSAIRALIPAPPTTPGGRTDG